MKIYTKTGDNGRTGLFDGTRVSKSSLRIDVYGTIDELNSIIGIITTFNVAEPLKDGLEKLNNLLFIAGTDLATPERKGKSVNIDRISQIHISWLEKLIDEYTAKLPELKGFIIPGGTTVSAMLHQARTVCRRAERLAVELASAEEVGESVIKFLNRLSDYLFTAARYANYLEGFSDKLRVKNLEF